MRIAVESEMKFGTRPLANIATPSQIVRETGRLDHSKPIGALLPLKYPTDASRGRPTGRSRVFRFEPASSPRRQLGRGRPAFN